MDPFADHEFNDTGPNSEDEFIAMTRKNSMKGGAEKQTDPGKFTKNHGAAVGGPYSPNPYTAGDDYDNVWTDYPGHGAMCQIYIRLICYFTIVISSLVVVITLRIILNSNLNDNDACPFGMQQDDVQHGAEASGDGGTCNYVQFANAASIIAAFPFFVISTWFVCNKRVRPHRLIMVEVILAALLFILQSATLATIALGTTALCKQFGPVGSKTCNDRLIEYGTDSNKGGFGELYDRLIIMQNSSYAAEVAWAVLGIFLFYRYRIVQNLLKPQVEPTPPPQQLPPVQVHKHVSISLNVDGSKSSALTEKLLDQDDAEEEANSMWGKNNNTKE
eukprot:m.59494 g.59494  ORF g.59494 m.59494 type:complete len:332 (-) comp22714_c2_seq1:594-1589(-)